MKITKELKYATFEYDEEEKDFVIEEQDGNKVILNKVYAFAFMRFVIRMAQRNWLRQMKKTDKKLDKPTEDNVPLEQMEFIEEVLPDTLQEELVNITKEYDSANEPF